MFPFGRMVEKDTEKLKGDIKGNAKEFWSEMEISWLELNMKISPTRVQISRFQTPNQTSPSTKYLIEELKIAARPFFLFSMLCFAN